MSEHEPETFDFDVFLSHSAEDKPTVRALADRLKTDGIRVWLDDWEIRLGDPIYAKIRDGLQRSRILLLFLSRHGLGSDWATLEHQTILFDDPLNRKRRFIPLLLDDAKLPAVLRQYAYLDWRTPSDDAYRKLLLACQPAPNASQPPEANTTTDRFTNGQMIEQDRESSRPDRSIQILKGHKTTVYSVAATPDGCHVVSASLDGTLRVWDLGSGTCAAVLEGHREQVNGVAITPDGRHAVSASVDTTLRVWDLGSGTCAAVLEGHRGWVNGVAITPDGRHAVSASRDTTLRVWDLGSGTCAAVLEGHREPVLSVAITPDGRHAVSASRDGTLRVWDLGSGTCAVVLEGHRYPVNGVTITPDGRHVVSVSLDDTLRVWDLGSGTCAAVLEGHQDHVNGVAITPDGRHAVSASVDTTLRVWDLGSGTCAAVLEGHRYPVMDVAITPDGRHAVSASRDGTLRLWNLDAWACASVLEGHWGVVYVVAITRDGRRAISASTDATLRVWDLEALPDREEGAIYTNAKVMLTGESGAGKTGLAQRLIHRSFEASYSTDGAWATQLKLEEDGPAPEGVEREIWLWDFAGQADYRLIHQLYMDGTDLALFVFDPQKDDPFEGLAQWDHDLTRAAGGRSFDKRLVAGRCDRGGLRVSRGAIEEFRNGRGFSTYHETSALTGAGCDALREAIVASIPWDRLPTTSPKIFKRIKEEILTLKDDGRVLLRLAELKQVLEFRMVGEPFAPEILRTVVGLLANAGVVWPLDFGGYILLHPERINAYAGALVRAIRSHSDEIGCIAEADVLHGAFPVPDDVRLDPHDQDVILRAMVATLLERGLCLKETTGAGVLLVFPAYFRRDRPELTEHPAAYVQYSFSGSLDEVYTTLVVRLHHTDAFDRDQLWRDAADFKTPATGLRAGLKMERKPDSSGVITVYLDPSIPIEVKATFMKFVHDHLTDDRARRASNVLRERFHVCERCGLPVDRLAVRTALDKGKQDIYCQHCDDGHRVVLVDRLEELFGAPETAERARQWNREAQAVMDSQSLEQILLGHVQAIAGEAGQIWRPTSFGDVGIDGEIEFKDHKGRPTGRRIYLQLKSGNSYLETRKKDGAEIFRIKKDRHATYWQEQDYPVWLVVRTTHERSVGTIRWMDLSAYLRQASKRRKAPIKQVEFRGEPLTAQALMALRDRTVPLPTD